MTTYGTERVGNSQERVATVDKRNEKGRVTGREVRQVTVSLQKEIKKCRGRFFTRSRKG